jgi:hypothetical protein
MFWPDGRLSGLVRGHDRDDIRHTGMPRTSLASVDVNNQRPTNGPSGCLWLVTFTDWPAQTRLSWKGVPVCSRRRANTACLEQFPFTRNLRLLPAGWCSTCPPTPRYHLWLLATTLDMSEHVGPCFHALVAKAVLADRSLKLSRPGPNSTRLPSLREASDTKRS